EKQLKTLGVFAAAVAALFVVGFGAGRVINLVRSGELSLASFQFVTPQAQAAATPTATPAPAVTAAALERTPWREVASRIDETLAEQIQTRAAAGDADAQAIAYLDPIPGNAGFLPNTTAASEPCNTTHAQ